MVQTAWLLGDPHKSGLDAVAAALRDANFRVESLPAERACVWCDEPDSAEHVVVPPNLLVVEAGLAGADDARLLRVRVEREPWRYLPLVVVSARDDPGACARAYDLGAASWIVMPSDSAARARAADVFARYWTQANLLPDVHYFRIA